MNKILIIYCSTYGNTERMARAVHEGAASIVGDLAELKLAEQTSCDHVRDADSVIAGTPIRHRSMDSRMKRRIETTLEILWLRDEMVGKIGGVFSCGGGYGSQGAGVEIAQIGILSAMAACGMILVPFPKNAEGAGVAGSHWGPNGRSGGLEMQPVGVTDLMLSAARSHGANIARVTVLLAGRGCEALPGFQTVPSPELVAAFSGQSAPIPK